MTDSMNWLEVRRESAIEAYHRDNRFRARVMQITSFVMNQHGPVNPERANQEASDIALEVAALMLKTIYEEDGELKSLVAQCAHYRKIAEEALATTPRKPIMIFTGEHGDD